MNLCFLLMLALKLLNFVYTGFLHKLVDGCKSVQLTHKFYFFVKLRGDSK